MFKALAETIEQVGIVAKLFYDKTKIPIVKQLYKFVGSERSASDFVRDIFRL